MVSFLYDNDFKIEHSIFKLRYSYFPPGGGPGVVAGTLNAAVTEGITSGLILL
jgi:hypothetical protein